MKILFPLILFAMAFNGPAEAKDGGDPPTAADEELSWLDRECRRPRQSDPDFDAACLGIEKIIKKFHEEADKRHAAEQARVRADTLEAMKDAIEKWR